MGEFYRVQYFSPNGTKVKAVLQKTIRGYHPVQIDENTLVEIDPKDIISMEKII